MGIGRVPAGPEKWYVLEIYPGCQECGTSWAVGLTLYEEGTDSWEWWGKDYPVIEFSDIGMWATEILNTEVLKRAFMHELRTEDDLDEAVFAFTEFVDRGGLKDVFFATRAESTS